MINYTNAQKFNHKLILGSQFIKKTMYELDITINKKHLKDSKQGKHVFLGGLARSGSTALLNYIYQSNDFYSLTYENMPYVMSPSLSKKFKYKKNVDMKERAHKDGILINQKSPEALDQIFLNSFSLDESVKFYPEYISLLLYLNNKTRYLSKNNNNHKRIVSLSKTFADSKFLIPVRHPLFHAQSLLNQHINFISLQKKDNFILNYMNYLGHFEFGLNHKPWNSPKRFFDNLSINYWLEQWLEFHKELLHISKLIPNLFFIIYEKLNQDKYLDFINQLVEIKMQNKNLDVKNQFHDENYDMKLFDECNYIYHDLNKICTIKSNV